MQCNYLLQYSYMFRSLTILLTIFILINIANNTVMSWNLIPSILAHDILYLHSFTILHFDILLDQPDDDWSSHQSYCESHWWLIRVAFDSVHVVSVKQWAKLCTSIPHHFHLSKWTNNTHPCNGCVRFKVWSRYRSSIGSSHPWTAKVKHACSHAEGWSVWDLTLIQILNTVLNTILHSLGALS